MIVVSLMGGLGNQMFQYALGRRLALGHATELRLDLSWFARPGPDTPRHYELDCFAVRAGFATEQDLERSTRASALAKVLRGGRPGEARMTTVAERAFSFDPDVLRAPAATHLVGYWQSHRYFDDIDEVIRGDFRFVPPLQGKNEELCELIRSVESVSLHVRRGDYATSEATSRFHGAVGSGYYRAALAEVRARAGARSPHLFVFSDDPGWCERHLAFDEPTTYVDHNPPDRGYEDMRLMSSCRHNVIANSSFGWWAAWLNPNPRRVVVAPRRWFADPRMDTSDLLPDDWIRM
jgi:hypothetical protein